MNTETSCIITRFKDFKTVQVGGHSTWPFVILAANCYNVRNCTSPTNGVCKATDICQCNPGFIGNRNTVLYMLLLIETAGENTSFLAERRKWVIYNLVLFSLSKFAMVTVTGRKKGLASNWHQTLHHPINPWEVDHSTGVLVPTLHEQHCGIFCVSQTRIRKCCETERVVSHPHPRRLECHGQNKGSTFSLKQ